VHPVRKKRLTDAPHPEGMRHDPHDSAGPSTSRWLPAAVHARRIDASSTASLDTCHLPRGHSTPAAAPLPPLTLVSRPSPPSRVSPPTSPSATTANVAVTVRPTWTRRKAARYAGGTRHLNAQGPYGTTVDTLPSTTTGLTPPSPCPPPPPQGPLAVSFRQTPRGCPRRQPAAHGNRQLSQWLLPREQTEALVRRLGEQGVLLRISCRNRLCCRIEQGTRLAHQVALGSI